MLYIILQETYSGYLLESPHWWDSNKYPKRVLCGNKKRTMPFLRAILLIKDSWQQQIHFNGNIFGNKCCRCNKNSLYFIFYDSFALEQGYSWLSLSRTRLSRIAAYLEVKIGSLLKHEHLTTGNKISWKRGEIAPKEQFLLFSTIFSIYLKLQESNYIYIC